LTILVEEDGTIRHIYDDILAPVFEGEEQQTVRASHVEPASTISWDGRLDSDMRPSRWADTHAGRLAIWKVSRRFWTAVPSDAAGWP